MLKNLNGIKTGVRPEISLLPLLGFLVVATCYVSEQKNSTFMGQFAPACKHSRIGMPF